MNIHKNCNLNTKKKKKFKILYIVKRWIYKMHGHYLIMNYKKHIK